MKRKRSSHTQCAARKKARVAGAGTSDSINLPDDGVLCVCYPNVQTLRAYLATKVPKRRRRPILEHGPASTEETPQKQSQIDLARLLDGTVVGSSHGREAEVPREGYLDDLKAFTQRRSQSVSTAGTSSQQTTISNVVDYCIWLLFQKHNKSPPHILCHGYTQNCQPTSAGCDIPGLLCNQANPYAHRLRSAPWSLLPALLGKEAESILIELFVHCGIFTTADPDEKNWLQISGVPLPELPQQSATSPSVPSKEILQAQGRGSEVERSLNSIRFVRHRMLYGKPVLNGHGKAVFGLRPIHVLNRYRNVSDDVETIHVMKHLFPRQFGLHNVFTSAVSKEQTAQACLDYTLRDDEIKRHHSKEMKKHPQHDAAFASKRISHLPKRLRGKPFDMVKALRKRHARCSYSALMQHYCQVPKAIDITATFEKSKGIFSLATPTAQVSAFSRAVTDHLIPGAIWGEGPSGTDNKKHIMKCIDAFIHLGRYESMSLHRLTQSFSLTALRWLDPPSLPSTTPLSLPETCKRTNLLAEFLYYITDSLLLPLLSANFYITETSTSRNRLLFFRHDVWLRLSTPALRTLQTSMFEPLSPAQGRALLSRGTLGTSRVRLLPKDTGLRPIVNLRRRVMVRRGDRMMLGRSTNSAMREGFAVLNSVKRSRPGLLGYSVFSVEDLGPRLAAFKRGLLERGTWGKKLWFAKVDVRQCFDSIPQERLLGLLEKVVNRGKFTIGRHAVGKVLRSHAEGVEDRVAWKFKSEAAGVEDEAVLERVLVDGAAADAKGRVYVDKVTTRQISRASVLDVLREHVGRNVVQMSRKLYRQKVGIAQGSVASSLLCSLFYGALDRGHLGFLDNEGCMVIRLIDDFLLVTTRLDLAKKFVRVMHEGIAEYGVSVKVEKSRTNFPMRIDGVELGRSEREGNFPYCGLTIDMASLNVCADVRRRERQDLKTAVTVEHTRTPGKSFYRKVLDMAKLHMHGMLLSTNWNDECTVLKNLQHAFTDMGWRCVHYLRGLKSTVSTKVVISTIEDLISFSFALMKKRKLSSDGGDAYQCTISRAQTQRIAYEALAEVFRRRQSGMTIVVEWLQVRLASVADEKSKRAAAGYVAKG